jgi:hypothetical protein
MINFFPLITLDFPPCLLIYFSKLNFHFPNKIYHQSLTYYSSIINQDLLKLIKVFHLIPTTFFQKG